MAQARTPVRKAGLLFTTWEKTCRRLGKQVVLIEAKTGEAWSADRLHADAERRAETVAGFQEGERIAFQLSNRAEWLVLFLALQRRRLVALPLDAGLPREGAWETAQRWGARALYTEAGLQSLEKTTRVHRGFCCLKTTSGSRGSPKAIACRAEHLLADGRNIIETMGLRPRDRQLATIPLGHSYGLGNLVMPLILQGSAVICASDYVPRQVVRWIRAHRVTVFPSVPAIFRVLADLPGKTGLPTLRTAISAGAVLTAAVAQAFHQRFGIKIHNFYGASETGGICYDRIGTASLTGRSIGRPLQGVSVVIKKGKIEVASSAVATRTGHWPLTDLGEWNRRGELVLMGRTGQGANIGGKKVHPLEVERVLRGLVAVTDAHVWREQSQGRDILVAAVETTLMRPQLEHALASCLPAWKLPKAYFIAKDLPRNARGKLDRSVLGEAMR